MEEQRTEQWFAARLGKVTASRVSDVMSRTAKGPGASRETYMTQLIAEVITGQRGESFSSAAMQWGTDQEPHARAAYELRTREFVDETGFHVHPRISQCGASPDGLVLNGLIEIKCPATTTHIEYLVSKRVPAKYQAQMQLQMAVMERPWCDFVSFDPRMPVDLQLLILRVERDQTYIDLMEKEVELFLGEMNARIDQLKGTT
ncbi:phage_rel_nuc, putative phage-type endonuclease [uncultured Caudovirales phage]|uniref:Phage_rel_nuc, putative phage-type endonuclease n=1 Tax=uncultured Caudovirales phage TaxID=2100421 RepID=A0A6J5KYL6_9CAUD|nr:phage_rel_nuc, putative phage-type endonuclease [uncultured Caudovirales phage]CAB5195062.1 phage_rel_nuc, putative phage-type endonuclease [uncultured Caudovirales phage]